MPLDRTSSKMVENPETGTKVFDDIASLTAQSADKAKKLSNRWIDVKEDFGAKGDGVTDDTLAINNAILDAQTKKTSVFFPTGTYLISTPIILQHYTRLIGNGTGETYIKLANGANCNMIESANLSVGDRNCMRVLITGLALNGNRSNNTVGSGIKAMLWDGVIDNCEIFDFADYGIWRVVNATKSTDDVDIIRCRIRHNSKYGIFLDQAPKTTVTLCYIATNDIGGILAKGYAQRIVNNAIYGVLGGLIVLDKATYAMVRNNTIEDTEDATKDMMTITFSSSGRFDCVDIRDNVFKPATCRYMINLFVGSGYDLKNLILENNSFFPRGAVTAGIRANGTFTSGYIESNKILPIETGTVTTPIDTVNATGLTLANNRY